MTNEERLEIGWDSRPLCMQLDNGTWIFPMADDEGNDGGALAVGNDETLPVFQGKNTQVFSEAFPTLEDLKFYK